MLKKIVDFEESILSMKSRTWAEVNIDNIEHNYNEFRRLIPKGKIMAVVKANAYGHGAVSIAKTLIDAGADYLAVASLDEALELRNSLITAPILVLNHVFPTKNTQIVEFDLTQTIYNYDCAKSLSEVATSLGKTAKVHVKVDTGMTRVGIHWEEAKNVISRISKLPNIIIEGLFTHFASADETDKKYTNLQFDRFMDVVEDLIKEGINIPLKHVCNSAASIQYPHMHLDMIRPGVSLYGLYPSDEVNTKILDLRPAMAFKTQIIRINDVKDGIGLSYGRIFTTKRNSKIITVPVGYADGYTRMLTGKARVLVNGQLAPVVGKICMDQCMVDVTDIKGDINLWDEVVLFGEQGGRNILADDLGNLIGTINYEIVCMVARRVPRFYLKKGKSLWSENYLVKDEE